MTPPLPHELLKVLEGNAPTPIDVTVAAGDDGVTQRRADANPEVVQHALDVWGGQAATASRVVQAKERFQLRVRHLAICLPAAAFFPHKALRALA